MLHGGIGASETLAPLVPGLDRRVILVDLQGHGRTADVDRPLRPELMADDIAALASHLGLDSDRPVRLLAGRRGRAADGDPAPGTGPPARAGLDRRPARREPPRGARGVRPADGGGRRADEASPQYAHYAQVAPRPEDWPVLIGKTGELLREDYDWTDEIARGAGADAARLRRRRLGPPRSRRRVLRPARRRAAAIPAGTARTRVAQLAVLPGTTHYDILGSPLLVPAVEAFLSS